MVSVVGVGLIRGERLSSLLRLILGDPDGRSPSEVRRDVDDELECHLQMLREDLRGEGLSEEEARAEAGRRFGDVDRYRKLCAEVALKERRMLARINLVLLVIVMVGVGVLSWRSFASQARTAEAVERLSLKIEQMSAGGGGGGAGGAANAAPPGRGETLAGGEVKVDQFGRAAEMQFTEQMRAKNRELRAEMFRVYDEKCKEVGYSTLRGRTETVLVVGDVERPGVYDLTKVKRARAVGAATTADVLRAAGVKETARGLSFWQHQMREKYLESDRSPVEVWGDSGGAESGLIIAVSSELPVDLPLHETWFGVKDIDAQGRRTLIADDFSDSAVQEYSRAERYWKVARDRLPLREIAKGQKAIADGAVMGVSVHERELIDGAVDLALEGWGAWTQRLLMRSAHSGVGMPLGVVLVEQLKGEGHAGDARYSKSEQFAKLAGERRLGVRVFDRLSGKREPVLDLAWDEAKASGYVVTPGALVVFYEIKNGAGKSAP